MANGSGIELPKVDFTTLNSSEIEVGSYFIGFDQGNSGKLSKMDHLGNITLIEGAAAPEYTYEIGQYVVDEGGVIAHRWLSTTALGSPETGTFQNYLVLDYTDLATHAQYATFTGIIPNVESTYDGQANTTNLIAAGAPAGIITGTAAVLCDSSTNSGFTDWYLPAIDELSKVWQNRWDVAQGLDIGGGVQMPFVTYWSSTESSNFNACTFNFSSGSATDTLAKTGTYHVRAVRRFSI
jgi:hypothetical protein